LGTLGERKKAQKPELLPGGEAGTIITRNRSPFGFITFPVLNHTEKKGGVVFKHWGNKHYKKKRRISEKKIKQPKNRPPQGTIRGEKRRTVQKNREKRENKTDVKRVEEEAEDRAQRTTKGEPMSKTVVGITVAKTTGHHAHKHATGETKGTRMKGGKQKKNP